MELMKEGYFKFSIVTHMQPSYTVTGNFLAYPKCNCCIRVVHSDCTLNCIETSDALLLDPALLASWAAAGDANLHSAKISSKISTHTTTGGQTIQPLHTERASYGYPSINTESRHRKKPGYLSSLICLFSQSSAIYPRTDVGSMGKTSADCRLCCLLCWSTYAGS